MLYVYVYMYLSTYKHTYICAYIYKHRYTYLCVYVCTNNNEEEPMDLRVRWEMGGAEIEWLVGPGRRKRRGDVVQLYLN